MQLFQRLGIDKAISYSLATQIFSVVRSTVSMFLVTKFLTAAEQGFFYTFTSILAIQIFFELGFCNIITQYAAHEKVNLTWENHQLTGEAIYLSRLNSLLRLTVKWFSVMSLLLFVILLVTGIVFFTKYAPSSENVNWQLPWILMASSTALSLFFLPLFSYYEGLGKVEKIAQFRFINLGITTIIFFSALTLHAKLYAYALNNLSNILISIVWFNQQEIKRCMLHIWHFPTRTHKISWRYEIFPYQWKIALSWISGYFLFQLFNPILFSTVGAKAAGQMGMSQAALTGIFGLANSWFSTKVPTFAGYIAQRDFERLDNLFWLTMKQSLLVMLSCLGLLFGGYYLAEIYGFNNLLERFLPKFPFLFLGISSLTLLMTNAFATYLRCHKKEPYLVVSIVSGILNVVSLYLSSKYFGIIGMTLGYLCVMLFGLIWGYWIFQEKRRLWHA